MLEVQLLVRNFCSAFHFALLSIIRSHHFHAGSVSADKDACIDWLVVHCPSGARTDICTAPGSLTHPLFLRAIASQV
jgi:hypothetical protein